MRFGSYTREALNPGGTPSRYLLWVSIVLVCQALASILPSARFYEPLNISHYLLGGTFLLVIGANLFKKENHQILVGYGLYIVGLVLSTITISAGITSLSGIVFMLTWAMTLFVAERREYISFDLVTIFMILMLLSTVVLLMFNPTMGVADNFIILATGATLTGVNIYLVYIDFDQDKNFYEESRKTYMNLEILSIKMSDILSVDEQLERLLWKVTNECVPFLDLEECVIYLYDEKKNKLLQMAAYGGKSSGDIEIINPIEIEVGTGIVGKCFASGETILVEETKNHPDYLVDDQERNSELAVPITSNGKVIGVIDSEHSFKGFFRERHRQAFHIIASFCGIKITEYYAKESIKQAQKAKEEMDRYKELDELKNRFITNISHDLKTPLSLIKAPAKQISQISNDKKVKVLSNYILNNADHLLRVVHQLLQLNRVDKGINELYLETVNLERLSEKVRSQYEERSLSKRIAFNVEIEPSIEISTDAFRLEQILHNLLSNAFRYTPDGGEIVLNAKKNAEFIQIKVVDNGSGIPEELHGKIFERFFKIDENNHEGTGIGLSLVKEYVQTLEGQINIESSENKGTTFQILLPAQHSDFYQESFDHEENWEESPQINGSKPLMLVVEDHTDLNNFICSYFEDKFLCISAFDGEEALKKIDERLPDIVVTDLMMPKMTGNSLVEKIREVEEYDHIPIVVLSAKSKTDSKIDLYKMGVDNFVAKPFDIEELEIIVSSTIDQRKKVRDAFRKKYLAAPMLDEIEEQSINEIRSEEVPELLSKAKAIVLENLDDSQFNVVFLAKQLGVGRNRFQKEIKDLTGITPVEFIRSIRLNEAKGLLENQSLSISEIAYSVGFSNLSYFTRSFKQEFGKLPSEFR